MLELNKRKIYTRFELIETIREILNDLDQEVIQDCVDSMTGRIMIWIQNRIWEKTGY